MNLPNSITVGRMVLVPVFVVLILTRPREIVLFGIDRNMLGVLVFGLAAGSDWLDGYVARRRRQVTSLGQWLDPLADKLLVAAGLIALLFMGRAPAWMVAVILAREIIVTMLRAIAHARGHALPASPLGKIKLFTQVLAILLLMFAEGPADWVWAIGQATLWAATIAALVSAADYSRRFATMTQSTVARLHPARPSR